MFHDGRGGGGDLLTLKMRVSGVAVFHEGGRSDRGSAIVEQIVEVVD